MQRMTGGKALVTALRALGVDTVFGIPGVHTLDIYNALYEAGEIKHILCRHEQGAAMMADGYARASGKPGVCTLITGPGLLNAATGLAQAYSDSSPIMVICSENPRPDYGGGRGLLHETKNQLGVGAAIVDWAKRATSARQIPDLVFEAWEAMTTGRPRPVYLEVPIDVLAEVATFPDLLVPPARRAVAPPSQELLVEAARLLSEAKRPAIIAGVGANAAAKELRILANRIGAACVTSVNGKGVFDEREPLSLHARGQNPLTVQWLNQCDTVLIVGTKLAPVDFRAGLKIAGTIIRVDIDPAGLCRNVTPDLAITGDAAQAVRFLAEHVKAPAATEVAERRAAVAAFRASLDQADAKVHPEYGQIQDLLRAALPGDAMIFSDMAGICYKMSRSNFPMWEPGTYRFPRGYGTLGWAMPAAFGAKLSSPERTVVAIAGDGGFLYTLQDLATAALYGVALPIILINNECYDEIRLAFNAHPEGTAYACDLHNPDFMDLAKAFKIRGVRLTDVKRDLATAIADALKASGPTIIEIPVAKAPPR